MNEMVIKTNHNIEQVLYMSNIDTKNIQKKKHKACQSGQEYKSKIRWIEMYHEQCTKSKSNNYRMYQELQNIIRKIPKKYNKFVTKHTKQVNIYKGKFNDREKNGRFIVYIDETMKAFLLQQEIEQNIKEFILHIFKETEINKVRKQKEIQELYEKCLKE